MSFDKIEVRVFSGPDQVQVGSNTEPDLIVMNIGPKGDTGATGNTGATGPAGPNSVTSATTSDGTANLSLSNVSTATATVSSLLTAGHIHGNLAGTLYTHVRTGEAMSKGDPFYISGFHVGSSQPIAMKADASNAAKMPAVGVMDADYANNTSGANGIISGTLSSVDTDGYAVNSPIYVANGGGYSNTAGTIPQQIGITERANVSTGAFIVTNSKVISFADVSDAQTGTAQLSLGDLEVVGGELYTDGDYSQIYTQGTDAHIFTLGSGAEIYTVGEVATIATQGANATISTAGANAGISTAGANATIYTLGTNATISTAGSAAHIQTNHASAAVKSTNFAAVESGGASLVDGSMQPCLTWSAGGRNLTIPSGTAVTFDSTSYTYGTGAAAAHRTALGLTTLATTTPGTNVANFLEFPTSDNLASALTDENGTGGGFVRAEGATLTSPSIAGTASFTGTTRPTSAGTGTPASTSLITKADGDKAFFPIEGLFTNAYKVPLTNNLGGASGLAAFSITAASDITSTFTLSGASGNYATWTSSFTRCQDTGGNLVAANGVGLCAKININTSGLRRSKLLIGGLSAASVLGAGVLDSRGFGVEIEPDPAATNQIRFRVIYRNQNSTTILGTWTSYYSVSSVNRIQVWTYRQDGELRAVFRTVNYNSITFTNWVVIPPVTVTSGDNFLTLSNRAKTFQIAAEGSGLFYAELAEMYETHNIFPNI